jgi:tetraacyldisaccharide 4'-kinase
MILKKPKFWDYKKPNLISLLLLPLTIAVLLNNFLIRIFNKHKSKKIKSICIGNIYLGGTGKTPSTIKLYQILKSLGYKVCVGKKFYNSQKDEQIILKEKTNLISYNSRKKIIEKSVENNNDIIIFDDGLQDKWIDYDLKFVCFDAKSWIGNGLLIPAGPLREKITSLKKYDGIFFKHFEDIKDKDKEKILNQIKKINPSIKIFNSEYFPLNLKDFDLSKKYLILSAIGNPESFKHLLIQNNFNIVHEITYPDHHDYTQEDLNIIIKQSKNLGTEIITTEKDFTKISQLNHSNINFLKIDLKINDEDVLINFLKGMIHE